MRSPRRILIVAGALLAGSCLRPADGHVDLDEDVGRATIDRTTWREEDGLAAIRAITSGEVVLWSASPVMHLTATLAPDAPSEWTLEVRNAMPDAQVMIACDDTTACTAQALETDLRTVKRWRLVLAPGRQTRLVVAPPDASDTEPFRFAVMSDVQTGVDDVEDVFLRMNEDPEIRFLVSTGDITELGDRDELVRFQRELEKLQVPMYTTAGNHEAAGEPRSWHELFGPYTSFFVFRGVTFSLVDSSTASIDPEVYDELEVWLDAARFDVHVFATHVPPLDPFGPRNFAFRSRNEAAKLLNMLSEGDVDVAFYGHLHTYVSYASGGIPSYISGGGGAIEERLDGIGRHFLTVDVTPGARVDQVALVRVDTQ